MIIAVIVFMLGLSMMLSKFCLFEMKNNLMKMHPVTVAGNPTKNVDLQLPSDIWCKLHRNAVANIA